MFEIQIDQLTAVLWEKRETRRKMRLLHWLQMKECYFDAHIVRTVREAIWREEDNREGAV